MSNHLSFLAGVMTGIGRARRRIGFIAFLAGVVIGILLGIGTGIGLGVGLLHRKRQPKNQEVQPPTEVIGTSTAAFFSADPTQR